MIRSLRIRFIRTAVLAVALVLFLILGGINLLNYRNVARDADLLLMILQDGGGRFPAERFRPDDDLQEPPEAREAAALRSSRDGDGARPEEGAFRISGRGFSEETPFESRYFSVVLDETGQILSYDISNIAAVDEGDLPDPSEAAFASSSQNGFYGNYRYLKYTKDGTTTVLFLDCARSLGNARSFLFASILVALLGLAGVFLLVVLMSGRVVRPVQESYEKQKRFITDAGHELKTPLTIIDADISVAEMETGPSEWLDDVKAQTRRLSGLTNDLIYLSRMNEGTTDMQMIDFPVSDVISDTVQSFRARAQVEEKNLTAEIEPMLSCHGDENAIARLAGILLDNAVKYAKEKGNISVSLRKNSNKLELVVENEADSLDPDSLPHFFDRFYRADASRNSSRGGYGIGLSIAQAIVTAHKGKITASAPEPDVFRITVILPGL